MKNNYILRNIFLFLFALLSLTSSAQILVNQDTIILGQASSKFTYLKTIPDDSGQYAAIINFRDLTGSGQDYYYIIKLDSDAKPTAFFEASSLHGASDFGTNIYYKAGFLYTVGFTTDSALSHAATCNLIKINYHTFDTVWMVTEAISHVVNQAPFSVTVDNAGNVYMGVGTQSTTTAGMDIIKYDHNGAKLWESAFDTTGFYTIPVAMTLTGSEIAITGFSFNLMGTSNFVTLQMNASTGAIIEADFSPNGTGMISHPVGIVNDPARNAYVAGTSTVSGNNSVIKLVKYDSLFNQTYVTTWGDSTKTNLATSIYMENLFGGGNVDITGSAANSSGGMDMVTLQYRQDGTLHWARRLSAPDPTLAMSGTAVTSDGDNTYTTGTVYNGVDTDVCVVAYDTAGNLRWFKTYNRGTGYNDVPYNIMVDEDFNVFVSAGSIGADSLYLMLSYEQYQISTSAATADSVSYYMDGEILVRFNPDILDLNFINNKDKIYDVIENIIPDSVLSFISVKCNIDLTGSILSKIVTSMNTGDSISISRGGDTIKVPKFWSSLLISNIPLGGNTLQNVRDSLNISQPYIFYTAYNQVGIFDLCDNSDSHFNTQTALSDPAHNVDVNWCTALNAGVVGSHSIKIGIYDSGINSQHEDLQYNGSTKIAGGNDYTNGTPIGILTNPNSDQFGHGTAITGIIGAQTINGKGLAGVAGGNAANPGCAIYCNKIGSTFPTITTATLYSAMVSDAGSNGLGLNVINHSYHYSIGDNFMHDAFRYSSRNGVVNACSTGDYGLAEQLYPSSFNNLEFTIRVGASDRGASPDYYGDWASFSDYGYGVDLIAPGTSDQYQVLSSTSNSGYVTSFSGLAADGTSFSTAFVSGTAGLLLSSAKAITQSSTFVNLAPEDVKQIIKDNTTSSSLNPSLDEQYHGAGRLNIGNAIGALSYPHYKIKHYSEPPPFDAFPTFTANVSIHTTWDYETDPNTSSTLILKSGHYTADRYEVQANIPYNISSTESIMGGWALPSQSDFWAKNHQTNSYSDAVDPDPLPHLFINTSTAKGELTGYVYHVTQNVTTGAAMDVWVPFNISDMANHNMAFSLWVVDNDYNSIAHIDDNKIMAIIYPSPANFNLNIEYTLDEPAVINLTILDINGREIMATNIHSQAGLNNYDMNITSLSSGMYFCKMSTEKKNFIGKFIKE